METNDTEREILQKALEGLQKTANLNVQVQPGKDDFDAILRIRLHEMEWDFAEEGEKIIYVKFADANGLESAIQSDSILIDSTITTANLVCNFNDSSTKLNSGCVFK